MTAIAALSHRGRVYLAGDSLLSDEAHDRRSYVRTPKVWRAGPVVVGVAGSVDYLAALGRVQWPARVEESWSRVRDALDAARVSPEEGEAVLGQAGALWSLSSALVPLHGPIAAAGSGAAYVLGSLSSSRDRDPAARVREAVRVAIRWCSSVGGRVDTVSG